MADKSAIEWTEATWNPVTGCSKVSPGCAHCYAETFAERWRGVPGHPYEQGFDLQLWPERLDQPLRWTRPRMIFVNSMSDLFHEEIPLEFIARSSTSWPGRSSTPSRSSRSARSGSLSSRRELELAGECLDGRHRSRIAGSSIAPTHLRRVPAAVRFISAEPLLGRSKASTSRHRLAYRRRRVRAGPPSREDGVGPRNPRPLPVEGVAFFFKQWGGIREGRRPRAGRPDLGRDAGCAGASSGLADEAHSNVVTEASAPAALGTFDLDRAAVLRGLQRQALQVLRWVERRLEQRDVGRLDGR